MHLINALIILNGADYNPEQWLETPEIIYEDLRLMKLAHINVVSIGIISWAMLEPEEGKFDLVNWKPINKLKRPGMVNLSGLQAIAHGSDTVQYFQWRQSRGSFEKFHGAVVSHCGHEHTRTFS